MKNGSINDAFYIGVDIGGTKISAGLVDGSGRIISSKKTATPHKGAGLEILQRTRSLIRDLLKEKDIGTNATAGIGVGVPGIVKPNSHDILITPNVKLSRYPLARGLEKAFGVKVVVGNDVNLGLLGAKWLGVGKNVKNLAGLFPGTGVGGAIVSDGKLMLGSQGAAGEFGHMIIDLKSGKKSAGLFGTLEALASRRAIERDIKEAVKKGKKTVITKMIKGKINIIKSGVISEALKKKDPLVVKIIDDVCDVLGHACINIRHIFNPDMIILGGGVIEACGDYILPRVRKISDGDPFFKGIDNCKIEKSKLGDDAIILGAVVLLRQLSEEEALSKDRFYPNIISDIKGNVSIGNRQAKGSVFVRADGKVKDIGRPFVPAELKVSKELGLRYLKKVCKKKPRTLIVGSLKNNLKISAEGRRFLDEKSIETHLLAFKDAVGMYNRISGKKAILFCR